MINVNIIIALLILITDVFLAWLIACKVHARTNPFLKSAYMVRIQKADFKKVQWLSIAGRMLKKNAKVQYFPGIVVFALALLLGRGLLHSISAGTLIALLPGIIQKMKKAKLNRKLGSNMYRIYRYLSNQISSGVKAVDAIKTVFNVSEDKELKACLVDLSARLELTNDLELAFSNLREKFSTLETESLYLTLKQGIETGTTGDLLEKQEEYHFLKYLSRIQAETDNSSYKTFAAALVFALGLCLLFIIPLILEAGKAVSTMMGS